MTEIVERQHAARMRAGRSGATPNTSPFVHLQLSGIKLANEPLYGAYLLKESLGAVLKAPKGEVADELDAWVTSAKEAGLPAFARVATTVALHRSGIVAVVEDGLSNARVESLNTRVRLITRRSFGLHSADALIALAMLTCGGLC